MADREDDARSFVKFLADLGDGYTARGLADNLRQMERALHDQSIETSAKAKGKIVLTLEFRTEPTGVCHVIPDVKVTLPQKAVSGGVMWHDPKTGHLSAANPKQLELGKLREVPQRARPRDEEEANEA